MRPRHSDEFDEIDNAIEHLFCRWENASDEQWDQCRGEVQNIVEIYQILARLPETEAEYDRLSEELFEIGDLFTKIAEKIEYLSDIAALQFHIYFNKELLVDSR